MLVERKHPITGKVNSLDLDVTQEDLDRWKKERLSVQDVFPHLNADQREFLISGLLPGDYDDLFPEEDDVSYEDPLF